MNLLITGINGFVGQALAKSLLRRDKGQIKGTVRSSDHKHLERDGTQIFHTGDINGQTDWAEALNDVDVIVHLAARVHLLDDLSCDPLTEFRLVNAEGTKHLAQKAVEAGVKRFVYVSSIKVNGENTDSVSGCSGCSGGKAKKKYSETDIANPLSPYSISKWEAEELLEGLSLKSGMEIVIVRPSLVYGAGVRANLLRLLTVVHKGVPLPFKSLANRRSMLYVGNLVDFLVTCIEHPAAAGEVFLLADGDDLSTPELIRRLAFYMSKPGLLFSCPVPVLRFAAGLLGKKTEIDRLVGSLQIDIGKAVNVLGWSPPFTVDEGLEQTVKWYLGHE